MKVLSCIFLTILACTAGKKYNLVGEPFSGTTTDNDYFDLGIDEYNAIQNVTILKDITKDDGLTVRYELYRYRHRVNPTTVTEEVPLCGTDAGKLLLLSLNAAQSDCPVSQTQDPILFEDFYDFKIVLDIEVPAETEWFSLKAILLKDGNELLTTQSTFMDFKEA